MSENGIRILEESLERAKRMTLEEFQVIFKIVEDSEPIFLKQMEDMNSPDKDHQ